MSAEGGEIPGNNLGKVIERARYQQGSTQREVAEKLGVHWVTISKLERGMIPVTREWAERLASVLPIDFNDLDPQKGRKSGYLLSGRLNDWGSVSFTDNERVLADGEYLHTRGRWFQINSHLFEPNLIKGDIVRISDVGDIDAMEHAQGRFCLAEEQTTGHMYFGLYTKSYHALSGKSKNKTAVPTIVVPFFLNIERLFPDEIIPSPLEMPFKIVGVVSQVIIPAIRPDLVGQGKTVFWE